MFDVTPYLVISLVTLAVSQIVKFAVHAFSNELDFRKLISVGGVPSSHIAVVTSLMMTSIAVDGINSAAAGITIVFGSIIIWDNLTVRTVLSQQIRKLSELSDSSKENIAIPDRSKLAIATGALVGLVSGTILSVSYWRDDISWFFDAPSSAETSFQIAFFGLLLAFSEVLNYYFVRRRDSRKLPTTRKLSRAFRYSMSFPAIVGMIITFTQQQTLGLFDARIWIYMIYDWIILASAWAWWSVYRHAKAHLAEEREHFKKAKAKKKSSKKKSTKKRKKK